VAATVGTSIERVIDAVGTSYRWWILATAALTLDSTHVAKSGTMDVAIALGTPAGGMSMTWECHRCCADLQQQEGQVRYDINVSINQLLLSFAGTRKFKMLTHSIDL
jgi:hypothetical protein